MLKVNIPRIEKPSPDYFFSEFISKGRPAVITGMMNWPIIYREARSIFDIDKEVFVQESRSGVFGVSLSKPASRQSILKFGELLERWESKLPRTSYYYMSQQPIGPLYPELLALIDIPPFLSRDLLATINLWMGEGGLRWHFDGVDNFLAHVYGRKTVRLISPENLGNMYVHGMQWSAIDDIDLVDLKKFPLAAGVKNTFDTTLESGEILFIPAGWWHSTNMLGGWGASVNFWFQSWYGLPKSVFERPFFTCLENLTQLLAEEVPIHERLHYCRYASEMLGRISNGKVLPMKAGAGWDNPKKVDLTPIQDRVPPRHPDLNT